MQMQLWLAWALWETSKELLPRKYRTYSLTWTSIGNVICEKLIYLLNLDKHVEYEGHES